MKPENFFDDYGKEECCIIGDHNGIYTTPLVIKLAMGYGFKDDEFNEDMTDEQILDNEHSYEVRDEAEEYLSNLLPTGYYFGNFEESGDVGIVKIQPEETEDYEAYIN